MRLAVQQVGVDLPELREGAVIQRQPAVRAVDHHGFVEVVERGALHGDHGVGGALQRQLPSDVVIGEQQAAGRIDRKSTSELQSLMRISYAVFCLKKKKNTTMNNTTEQMLICSCDCT